MDTGADTLRQLDEDSLDYTAKELEARLIAGRIRQLVSEDQGILVWDKSRGGYRRARYGDNGYPSQKHERMVRGVCKCADE